MNPAAQLAIIKQFAAMKPGAQLVIIKQLSSHESCGPAGDYQADEQA